LIEISESVASGRLNLEEMEHLDDDAAVDFLRRLKGVGRWTAEYTLLRGLGRLNIFPRDDVGSRIHLHHWLSLIGPLDLDSLDQTLLEWTPYSGVIYFHLLLQRLASSGTVKWD
jgi:DNA-3-methyladenine glycosylase II